MLHTITPFDTNLHHIHIPFVIIHPQTKTRHSFDAIIDTGAPQTEFSDVVLARAGFIDNTNSTVKIKKGLATQKYGKLLLPTVEICGHPFNNFETYISKLDESWGIDALIGLNFFRKFEVTINYKKGQLIVKPL